MEGRRVEGVFLDSSILRNRAQEAYRASRVMEIRVLSSVPEALLASLGDTGSRFTALVREVTPQKVILMLENGYEIHAENRLSRPVKEGERLTLLLESKNPFVLRVERSFLSTGIKEIWRSVLEGVSFIKLNPERIRESFENSGLIYERKVWEFLKGDLERSSLERDTKFVLLRRLSGFNTSQIEEVLRWPGLPEDLREKADRVLELARRGDRVGFLAGVRELSSEVSRRITLLEGEINSFNTAVARRVRTLFSKLEDLFRSLGVRVHLKGETFISNPKALDVIRSVIDSLKLSRWGEAVEKLRIVGFEVKDPEIIPALRDRILSQMEPLVRGAVQGLLEDVKAEDLRSVMETFREKQEELENLRIFRENLEGSVPKGVRENLHRLDLIGHLQGYLISRGGRKFILPFKTEEGRGVLLFSLENTYRILVKIDFDDGFIGVIMEAPKVKNPGHVNITFITDIPEAEREIELRSGDLKRDIEEVGLKLRRFEVKGMKREDLEERIVDEIGEDASFTLRV
ncbi:MAG: hypothetical protein Q9N26_08835 [Aquificota bacterium]|nr:hypothetical protein [Aquificota bacterium]